MRDWAEDGVAGTSAFFSECSRIFEGVLSRFQNAEVIGTLVFL